MLRKFFPGLLLLAVLARTTLAWDLVHDSVPMKWIEPLMPEDLPDLKYPEYFTDLDKAQAQEFAGRNKLSLITLSKLKDLKADQLAEAAVIKGKALDALGRGDDAIAALSEDAIKDDPAVQVQMTQVLAHAGKLDDALSLLKAHLQKIPDSISGHYWMGAIAEQVGDLQTARDQYSWFVSDPQKFLDKWQTHQRLPVFEKAEQVTTIARALDRWATLTEAYRNNANLDKTILSMFVKAFDEIDREYYPARLAAAEYLLSHDQAQDAAQQLKAVLTANPNCLDALKLMGHISLEQFDFDNTDRIVAAIRKVNRQSIDADLLDARNLMQQRRPEDAEPVIRKTLAQHPKNIEALGLLAAVNALQLKEDKANDVLRQVDSTDPHNASAYFEVAQQLGAMRQYPRAIEKFKTAIERAPWWTAARNGLGLLYTQSGDEESAHKTLDEAHQLDPFNLSTTNYLRLLDTMDGYARKESPHFVVIYDPQTDPVIPEYFLDYLESVQEQVCGAFHFTPAVKTFIEVFPSHDAFSVRTTGSTWIPTVGASTGRVIALVAPRGGKTTMGTFNWARVLRHEYTHTVTLGATDNRIAHWFTEGLAVYEEQSPVPWEWVPMLYQAVSKKEFFPLDKLTWAFIRPRRPIDRQLAYAESFWICKYVEQTYGHDAILQMLDLMRHADRQEDVFPKVTGKTIPQFMAEFQAWAEQQVSGWGYDEQTSKKYDELRKQGDEMIEAHQFAEAAKVYEQIAAIRPVDQMPHQKLAVLYLRTQDVPKAIEQFQILSKVELKDNRYAKRIARLYRDEQNWDKTAEYALISVYIDPYDLTAHQLFEEACEKTNNPKGAEREKRVIEELTKLQSEQETTKD